MSNAIEFFQSGGIVMYPLLICSFIIWAVIFERAWHYRQLSKSLKVFHMEALNVLLREDHAALPALCRQHSDLPTARLVQVALDRLGSKNSSVKKNWKSALERSRQVENQDLRKNLWMLGTIASASPFIGLFGTVLGILQSFGDIANTGEAGFTVVAGGISEALVATAAGIIVAVVAVMAFNAFQTHWARLVLTIRLQVEELEEMIHFNEDQGLGTP